MRFRCVPMSVPKLFLSKVRNKTLLFWGEGPAISKHPRTQDSVTEYKDYLDMCRWLDYDMKNRFVLYPKDLQKANDRVQRWRLRGAGGEERAHHPVPAALQNADMTPEAKRFMERWERQVLHASAVA